MDRKRKLSNLKEKCRICLADHGSMTQIFDERIQGKIMDLSKCTSIDIKDERDFPRIICHVCLYKLEMWDEFKEQFIRSNALLSKQLELSDNSDSTVTRNKKNCTELEDYQARNCPGNRKTKTKPGIPPLIPLEYVATDSLTIKNETTNIFLSEDDPASSKDSFQKDGSTPNASKQLSEVKVENINNLETKSETLEIKHKTLNARRSKTTERRIASTKRWVERKKALIAATGETISDTDSIGSDDTQLSPVQKAQAKSNADKEAEKQKRIARALKNLETNMTEKYNTKLESEHCAFGDTNTDGRITRSHKTLMTDSSQKDENLKQACTEVNVGEKGNISPSILSKANETCTVSTVVDGSANSLSNNTEANNEKLFTPHSVKTELHVGDAKYIVTSTLVLAEPNDVSKSTINKHEKPKSIDENSQEKNTDIIDAVQLRRVNPAPSDTSETKRIERCLNIEVEGSELETLKQVQMELANFVENEMKNRLCGIPKSKKGKTKMVKKKTSVLNEQLKIIVEKVIKKNIGMSVMNIACGTSVNTSSPIVQTATNMTNFQPEVVLHPLNINEESQRYKISNMSTLQLTEEHDVNRSAVLAARKRKYLLSRYSDIPRYNEYITSGIDSDITTIQEKPSCDDKTDMRNIEILPKSVIKDVKSIENDNIEAEDVLTRKVIDYNTMTTPIAHNSSMPNETKIVNEVSTISGNPTIVEAQQRIVYESSLDSKEMEIQNTFHKVDIASENVPVRRNKQKLMRCKRCHEIVEARVVKQHVCRSKYVHKCYVCNLTFRTEKILARHLKSHDQSEFKLNIVKIDSTKTANANSSALQNNLPASLVIVDQANNEILRENINTTECKKEIYTCFVCNKTFTDEEVLKDHLQKHCDDISEDEDSTGKQQYQCAICGDSMESEDALEEHVEKHLFNDEDDNPNLISIGSENDKKETSYLCSQCTEVFNSEMLLEMHMQAHEEEAAIAEWERQGMKAYEYQCMICGEVFGVEEELFDHLNVHNLNTHVCQLCEKAFATLEDLQTHVASH